MGGRAGSALRGGPSRAQLANEARWSTTADHWGTPWRIVERLLAFFGEITLDPCSNEHAVVPARIRWGGLGIVQPSPVRAVDGLFTPWNVLGRRTRVFVNPPFSAKLLWMRKAENEHRLHGCEIIALVPADLDTGWWHDVVVASATRICFPRGRLSFLGDRDSNARFPVALPYWGERVTRFESVFRDEGWVVAPRELQGGS